MQHLSQAPEVCAENKCVGLVQCGACSLTSQRGRAKETDSEMPNDLQLPPDSQDKAINLHSPAVKRWDTVKPPHSITMSLISVFSSIPSFHPPHPWRWIQSPGSYGFSACSDTVLSCLAVFYSRLGQVAVANSSCWCGGRASPARGPAFWQDVLRPAVAGAYTTAP